MQVIRKDFLPADLAPLIRENQLQGCVVVQSDQSELHNTFLLELAAQNDFIKGIVGWVDLQNENVSDRFEYYNQFNVIKGFRHVLQGEANRALMLKLAFMRGIDALGKYDFTYDILIYPDQMKYIPEFVAAFPQQKFVIDHLAKPYIKDRKIDEWQRDMYAIAKFDNVFCKVSGMVTEADFKKWKQADFTPYLDVVVNAFGIDRLMYGSDWPVCLVAGNYATVLSIVKDYFSLYSEADQQKVFGINASRFYKL